MNDFSYIRGGIHETNMNADITEQEILDAISHAKADKSPGCDEILNEMLKAGTIAIVPFLRALFQRLFDTGYFPLEWAKSIIVPIFKKGNVNLCENYRGVSLTSLISKLYTRILNVRITNFNINMTVLPEEQGGYREKEN